MKISTPDRRKRALNFGGTPKRHGSNFMKPKTIAEFASFVSTLTRHLGKLHMLCAMKYYISEYKYNLVTHC